MTRLDDILCYYAAARLEGLRPTVGTIASAAGIDPANAAKLVARLHDAKMLRRQHTASPRGRQYRYVVTPAGAARARALGVS